MTAKKTFTFAISAEMKTALAVIRERDGVAEAEQICRGIQMWLDSKSVQQPKRKGTVIRKRPL